VTDEIEAIRERHQETEHDNNYDLAADHGAQAHFDRETLLRLLDAAREELAEATNYARRLATGIARKHFPENTNWEVSPDLMSILTQIDNATCGLVRAAPVPEAPSLDEIEAIQARHKSDSRPTVLMSDGIREMHTDRATLLRLLGAAREKLAIEQSQNKLLNNDQDDAALRQVKLGVAYYKALISLAAVREAAEPFLRDRCKIADGIPDDTSFSMVEFPDLGVAEFTVGDLRRLTAALAKDATTETKP